MASPANRLVDGKKVRLSSAERRAIVAEWAENAPGKIAARQAAEVRKRAREAHREGTSETDLRLRALQSVMLNRLNLLGTKLNLPPLTQAEFDEAITAAIDADGRE